MKDVAVALTLADEPALSALLRADPATAIREVEDLPPLLVLLRRSTGSRAQVLACARLLLNAGADPNGALWGVRNNRAEDGDYVGTVEALLAAGAPTRHEEPTGHAGVDALLADDRTGTGRTG